MVEDSKNNKEKKSKNSESDDFEDIHDVEQKIEEILSRYQDKLIIESFSLKNKDGKKLYYFKKKSKKEDKDPKKLSKEIITEARDNLGEDPNELGSIEDTVGDQIKDKKDKHLKIGKNKTMDSFFDDFSEDDKKVLDSEEYKKVVSEVDTVIDDDSSTKKVKDDNKVEENVLFSTDEDKPVDETGGLFGKKKLKIGKKQKNSNIVETSESKKIEEDVFSSGKKEDDSTDSKSGFFGKKKLKTGKKEKQKEKDVEDLTNLGFVGGSKKDKVSSEKEKKKKADIKESKKETSGFFGKKKVKVKKKDEETDFDKKTDRKMDDDFSFNDEKDDSKFLDGKIEKDFSDKSDVSSSKEPVDKAKDIPVKDLDLGKLVSSSKENKQEDSKDVSDVTEVSSGAGKTELKFRVDNLPVSNIDEDEAELLDEKIKDLPAEKKEVDSGVKIEEKAKELAKSHIKEKPSKSVFGDDKKSVTDDSLNVVSDAADHEHVFFDEPEGESGFVGWSPQISEKDRKKLSLPETGKTEVDLDELKGVGDIELPRDVLATKSVKLSDLGFSENEWEELDFYPLHEPFAYVEILREKDSLDKCYFLVEVELTEEEEEIMEFILETVSKVSIDTVELDNQGDDKYLSDMLENVVDEYDLKVSDESKNKIFYYIGKTSLGLGKIDPLLKDPNIEDISCDGSNVPLFLYHRTYGSLRSNIEFKSEDQLSSFIFRLAQKCGKHISIAEPMLDATMPDGSRIQMTLSDEITAKGSTFTIRKFREDPFSPPDLVEFNTMNSEMVAYMWLAIENGVNTLFAGGTASGKTTALNALALFVPRESKIVSIEETREINLPHPNWIPGVARSGFGEVVADRVVGEIDMYDLMKAALRQRPEYILVGEIRGREAYVLFQAMATGHATYSTVHADSAQSLIHRLEGKPINIPRVMLQSLDIVSLHVITRVKNKRARRCKQIIEIIDIDPTTKEILTNEVFRWDPVEDKFIYSGKSYVLERVRAEKDLTREQMTGELKQRKEIVEWMNNTNVRQFRDVAKVVTQYGETPEDFVKRIRAAKKKSKKDDKK